MELFEAISKGYLMVQMTAGIISAARGAKENEEHASSLRTPSRKLAVAFLYGFQWPKPSHRVMAYVQSDLRNVLFILVVICPAKVQYFLYSQRKKSKWLMEDTYSFVPLIVRHTTLGA